MQDSDNNEPAMLINTLDMTQQKTLEMELEQAKRELLRSDQTLCSDLSMFLAKAKIRHIHACKHNCNHWCTLMSRFSECKNDCTT